MARREVLGSRAAGGPVLLTVAVAVAVGTLGGCSGGGPDPTPATTSAPPTTAATSATVTSAETGSSTASGPAFDCSAVDTAQQALDDAYTEELDRLDVHRGDPRAQSVYALVTTTQGPAYYSAVLAAAAPEESSDAELVLDYYRQLSAQVGDLEVDDGSEQSLAEAMDRLDAATLALDPTPATAVGASAVVAAQERLQAEVERACSGPDASSSPTTGSVPGSSTTTG